MKCFMAAIFALLMVGVSYGQPMAGPMPYPPYQPGSTTQYIQAAPQSSQTPPLVPPNQGAWDSGWKETYTNTHEYRPLRPYEYEQGNGHHGGYYPQQYQPQQYQQYQYPQQQVYYPQQQQQWCVPQQQYYCYPQQNGWRLPYFMGGPRW